MRPNGASWKTEPLPDARARLSVALSFDAAEWGELKLGFIPEEMEDKWFIYEDGGWLNFHRSWTGMCIYRVRLHETPAGGEIAEAWVNRDAEQYHCVDDAYDAGLLLWLIEVLLLKKPARFPGSDSGPGLVRRWCDVGRAMLIGDEDGKVAAGLERALWGPKDRAKRDGG